MILLDSSLIVAYSNEADENHVEAVQVVEGVDRGRYGASVISDYIFDETVTVMLVKTRNLVRATKLGEVLLKAALMFRVDEDTFNLAWKIFKEQQKSRLSFTDCSSIAVCRMNGISNIATFDEDFKKLEKFNIIGL